jgi:hypothetical protein
VSGTSRARGWEADAAWWAETPAVASLDFGLATTIADFEGAFRLAHDRYVWRRYMAPEPSGRRLGLHHVLPSTKVVVAKAGDRVVGTITVVEDSCLGLPMDEAFGEELGRFRERGRRLAEGASLVVGRVDGVPGVAIVVRLLRMAVLYAARIARRDELCFVVRPRHREFYLNLFPFRRFSEMRFYPRIGGADVIGLRLDLQIVRALVRIERAGLSAGPLSKFLSGRETSAELTARLRRDVPRSTLTPPEWARLFADTAEPAPDPSTLQVAAVLGAVHSEPGGCP